MREGKKKEDGKRLIFFFPGGCTIDTKVGGMFNG